MIEVLTGHDLMASASDGKWLSALLRAARFPRDRLRLRRSDEAMIESARSILSTALADAQLASGRRRGPGA